MRFRFIEAENANYPERLLCRVLGGSRADYYAARCRLESARSCQDQRLLVALREAHAASRRTYNSLRLPRELCAQGGCVATGWRD